ncbi:MAG: hypothetical protein GYA55_11605 [SAR324 cluster bacterium]|uniref:Uncharacterized protein n=1 Tax=SAR324 cluster bacterium TaxID=2024889 RepID=A0A7X9FT54_9DELT|nr:hypothetical protein [SAR324 cluster bacterium]
MEEVRKSIYEDALVIRDGSIIVADLRPCYSCTPPWCVVDYSCKMQKPRLTKAACGGNCTNPTVVPAYPTAIPAY